MTNKPPKGCEMCQMVDGKPSNGALMLELLGDEPDVSYTSREALSKLGMFTEAALDRMYGPRRPTKPDST
jgi:hypothetical protein